MDDEGTSASEPLVAHWHREDFEELKGFESGLAWLGFDEAWCVRDPREPGPTFCVISLRGTELPVPGIYMTGPRNSVEASRQHLAELLKSMATSVDSARDAYPPTTPLLTDRHVQFAQEATGLELYSPRGETWINESPHATTRGVRSWQNAIKDLPGLIAENIFLRDYLKTAFADRTDEIEDCDRRAALLLGFYNLIHLPYRVMADELMAKMMPDVARLEPIVLMNLSLNIRLSRLFNSLAFQDAIQKQEEGLQLAAEVFAEGNNQALIQLGQALRTGAHSPVHRLLGLKSRIIALGLDRHSIEEAMALQLEFPELAVTIVSEASAESPLDREINIQGQSTMASRLGYVSGRLISLTGDGYSSLTMASIAVAASAHHAAATQNWDALGIYSGRLIDILERFRLLELAHPELLEGDDAWAGEYRSERSGLEHALLGLADCLVGVGWWAEAEKLIRLLTEWERDPANELRLKIVSAVAKRRQGEGQASSSEE